MPVVQTLGLSHGCFVFDTVSYVAYDTVILKRQFSLWQIEMRILTYV